MIEDYQAKRRRARLVARGLLVAGVSLAVASAVVVYLLARSAQTAVPTVATTGVLVAARDIAPRTTIGAGDVKVAQLTVESVPAGALRDPSEAVGRIATIAIARNEAVLPSKFVPPEGTSALSVFPVGEQPSGSAPDWRAMSLSVPEQNAVGGALLAGDVVDLIVSFSFSTERLAPGAVGGEVADFAARIVAERVPILARSASSYVVRIEAQQAERLAALQAAGATVHLILRGPGDTRDTRARGSITSAETGIIVRAIPTPTPAPTRAP